jgi:hypothetical protein
MTPAIIKAKANIYRCKQGRTVTAGEMTVPNGVSKWKGALSDLPKPLDFLGGGNRI